ncbi:hypothetical protein PsYK624_104200 [Phanerochaete sordida]|uniref:Uncharacterized protein n=1 Tax=Phanerochaete sordida TaxID=48140 RepID=A0A9P3GG04_9APHY|nr:hypothetical protein PsYK624_104200 [Phanerochaete sordida]
MSTRASARVENATPSCPAPTPIPTKKKSRKKNSGPQEPSSEDSQIQDMAPTALPKPSTLALFESNGLMAAFQVLDTLIEARRTEPPGVSTETYALAISRAIDSLAATLASLLPPADPSSATSSVMQTLSDLLRRLVLVALPLIRTPRRSDPATSCARTDALIGRLSTTVLIPVVTSFYPLSLAHLTTLFSPDITAKSPSCRAGKRAFDARPAAASLLHTALTALHELSRGPAPALTAAAQSARAALTLSAARALAELYDAPATVHAASDAGETARAGAPLPRARLPPQLSPCEKQRPGAAEPRSGEPRARPPDTNANARVDAAAARIAALARKDAMWYLCSVLHATVAPLPGAANVDADRLLREGVCTVLAGLLRWTAPPRIHVRCATPRRDGDDPDGAQAPREGGESHARGARALLGAVEREMVLAVAEKVWLSQG